MPEQILTSETNSRHGNLQKHTNSNPAQQYLLNRFHRRILQVAAHTQAKTALDVGCGEGFTLHELEAQKVFPNAVLTGVDFSASALAWSRENAMTAASLGQADIHRLPFPDNSFDLVYCLEVLEHLPDSTLGLKELARVSKEWVLLSVPHEPFFRGANFLRGKHLSAWGNDPEHLHNYTGAAFQKMISGQVDILWHGYSFPWQIALARKR